MKRAISFQEFNKGDTRIVYEDDSFKVTCTPRKAWMDINYVYIITDSDGDVLAMDFGNCATQEDKIESLITFCKEEAFTPIKNNPFF